MEIKYEQKYVAFLDVLGFSSLVEKDNKEKLDNYFSVIERVFKFFDDKKKPIKKLIISDSIILTAYVTEENFLDILQAIKSFQGALAPYGIWVRGGISFGEVYDENDKNLIVGKGYIRAYLLEQQAIYPRVIIDPSILAKMNLNRKQFYEKYDKHEPRNASKVKAIHDYGFYNHKRHTQDDAIFICYANAMILFDLQQNKQIISKTYFHIKEGLYGEQKHYHKYLWLKKYFLECLEELDFYTENKSPHKPVLKKLIEDFSAL